MSVLNVFLKGLYTLCRYLVGDSWRSKETFSRLQCSQFNCSVVNARFIIMLEFICPTYFLISGHTFTILLLLMLLYFTKEIFKIVICQTKDHQSNYLFISTLRLPFIPPFMVCNWTWQFLSCIDSTYFSFFCSDRDH